MHPSFPAAPSAAPADEIELASDLLGRLAVPAEAIVDFPRGLPGFSEQRRFALLPAGRPGLHWLQSAEVSGLVFLLADAFHWFPDYDIAVPDGELAALDVRAPSELAVFAVVTLPGGRGESASANLRAPVLVSTATRRAQQLVLADDRYAVREPLALG